MIHTINLVHNINDDVVQVELENLLAIITVTTTISLTEQSLNAI